jgi:hypothetical protein
MSQKTLENKRVLQEMVEIRKYLNRRLLQQLPKVEVDKTGITVKPNLRVTSSVYAYLQAERQALMEIVGGKSIDLHVIDLDHDLGTVQFEVLYNVNPPLDAIHLINIKKDGASHDPEAE